MKGFWKIYLGFTLFAVFMFSLAWVCYEQAYLDPTDTEAQVSQMIEKLDSLGESRSATVQQRALALKELLSERNLEFKRSLFGHLAEAFMLSGVMILTAEGLTRFITAKEVAENAKRLTNNFTESAARIEREFTDHSMGLTQDFKRQTDSLTDEFKRRVDDISENVWNAISARLVPDPIASEIKQILKSDICRVRPEYTITLERAPHPGLPDGHIVVRRELYYRLLNLTGGEVKYPISIRVLSHTGEHKIIKKDGTQVLYPRICDVHERDVAVTLTPQQRTSYENTVVLPKMDEESESLAVWSVAEEVCTTTDRALYVLTAPCYGLILNVVNKLDEQIEIQRDNVYLTNGSSRLRQITRDRWECEGGILAGTALSLSWRAIQVAGSLN